MFHTDIAVKEFERLQKLYQFHTCFETGTHRGHGSMGAARFCTNVYTAEVDEESWFLSRENFRNAGWSESLLAPTVACLEAKDGMITRRIVAYHMSSPKMLEHRLEGQEPGNRACFYLDAHWDENAWPLRAELEAIRNYRKGNDVIIVHDCRVPESWEPGNGYGYDTYKGQELSYEYIADLLQQINPKFTIQYNHGGPRGILYALPELP
jgi:hypothetical protein